MNNNLDWNKLSEYLENPAELPQQGFTTLPSDDRQVIRVIKGKTGYYPVRSIEDKETRNEFIDEMNEYVGANPVQVEALMILSMRRD